MGLYGAYPFLYGLSDGTGYVPLFVDFWLSDPRLSDSHSYRELLELPGGDGRFIQELRWYGPDAKDLDDFLSGRPGPLGLRLPGPRQSDHVIGLKIIERCGPGWWVTTVPYAGVRWVRRGRMLAVEIDPDEQVRSWFSRIEKTTHPKSCRTRSRHASERTALGTRDSRNKIGKGS